MGVASSAAYPIPEAIAPADPPAKEDIQPAAVADAPADSPAKDSPVKEDIEPAAVGGDTEAAGKTAVFDAAEEEEEECPFCLYMKGGGCKEEFVEWEKCVEETEADDGGNVVKQCGKVMAALGRCMENYPDYYTPVSCNVDRQFWGEDLPL
ncbi:uncharacterized protein LOC124696929 [Lolium rigidum]|uniref:uncharacterized protein LOC124696929 n=1 Tax=Lolium rigidum TaxID=89674 RepID=UPI001F5D71E7|nr:uncharacterized protein LOC124696929 [Lolium rigidum]